jgi:hypothetical protein
MKKEDPRPSENATSSPRSGSRRNEISIIRASENPHSRNDPGESTSNETEHQASTGGDLERAQTAPDGEAVAQVQNLAHVSIVGPVHSVFSKNQKRFIVFMASFGGFFSPISASIYFPALNALALDLGVTSTLINLTLTSYMVWLSVELSSSRYSHPPMQIFQGLAPSVIGNLADSAGRRPAYTICFVIYIGANIGLALQNDYPALFVLRCIQSSGSSGTIALSSGVVSDIATVSERGKYLGFITAGSLLGPAIGPVVGGVLVR